MNKNVRPRLETSLEVQWLRLPASIVGSMGPIPGHGNKSLHTTQHSQKKKKDDIYIFFKKKNQAWKCQSF